MLYFFEKCVLFSVLFICIRVTLCESAKILYLMPFTAKSHYIGMKNLALELAEKGHDVYAITPFLETNHSATYHQLKVDSDPIWNRLFSERPNVFSMTDYSFEEFQMLLYRSGFMVNELVFNSPDVQKFLEQEHKIDLVICEVFFNEALYMLAHKFQAPLVFVTTFGNSFKMNYHLNNPLQLSVLYHEYGVSSSPTSFFGRLKNLYYCFYDWYMLKFWYYPKQEKFVKKYYKNLPEPVPSLEDIAANASLVLMNSYFGVDGPAAYLPNFIEVAGLHIKTQDKAIPEDLQSILDGAKDGVVFMSLGSNVHVSELGQDKLDAFLTVFGELKQTVIMKWEDEKLPATPKNVILRQWLPQKEVLAHQNVKLFIGHGGLLGLQETMVSGIPILGIPVFGDQYINILQTVKNGHGELLEHKNINRESVRYVVNKMLSDKGYSEKAKEIAVRFKDRPMSGLETAVWWIEYVLRHKGASFMKNNTLQMNYFELNMLDVYLFLVSIVITVVYVILKLIFSLSVLRYHSKVKKQ